MRFGCAKEVVIVHDCSIIWPCPVSTPTSIEDLDLPNAVKNEDEAISQKSIHTTTRRGKTFLSLPPPTRPFHTLSSPASQTSGRSNAPGSSSRLSNLTHEVDGAWSSREVAVSFVHRARRAAKWSGPGGGRSASTGTWTGVDEDGLGLLVLLSKG
jgi:hypothetical protein